MLWSNLETVANSLGLPWMAIGDFNEVLTVDEKKGGGPLDTSRALRFAEMLDNCDLTDLGFIGPRFTWTNLRQHMGLI